MTVNTTDLVQSLISKPALLMPDRVRGFLSDCFGKEKIVQNAAYELFVTYDIVSAIEDLGNQKFPIQQWTIRLQQEIGTPTAKAGEAVRFWCDILQPAVIQAYRDYKRAAEAHEVSVQTVNISGIDPANLVERGFIALEDEEWSDAGYFFEQALNLDARNARAYLGKALLSARMSTQDELAASCLIEIQDDKDFKRAKRFADPIFASELDSITSEIARRVKEKRLSGYYEAGMELKRKAARVKSDKVDLLRRAYDQFCKAEDCFDAMQQANDCQILIAKVQLTGAVKFLSDVDTDEFQLLPYEEKKEKLSDCVQVLERIIDYEDASDYMEIAEDYLSDLYQRDQYQHGVRCKASVKADTDDEVALSTLTEAIQFFTNAGDYKDSAAQIAACSIEMKNIQLSVHYKKGTMLLQEAVYASDPLSHFQQAYAEFCLAEDYGDAKQQALNCANEIEEAQLNQAISFLQDVPSEDYQHLSYSKKEKQLSNWIQVLESIIDYKNAAEYHKIAVDYRNELRSEKNYQAALKLKTDAASCTEPEEAIKKLTRARKLFYQAGQYEDAENQAIDCSSNIEHYKYQIVKRNLGNIISGPQEDVEKWCLDAVDALTPFAGFIDGVKSEIERYEKRAVICRKIIIYNNAVKYKGLAKEAKTEDEGRTLYLKAAELFESIIDLYDARSSARECRVSAGDEQTIPMPKVVEEYKIVEKCKVVEEYYPLATDTRECPFCHGTLVYRLYNVAKKNGKQVKLNFLNCSKCGCKFIVMPKAESYHLEECDISELPIEKGAHTPAK